MGIELGVITFYHGSSMKETS